MTAISARRHFGALDITGLLALDGAIEVIVSLCADPDARELLAQAAAADKLLDGDPDSSEDEALAKARLEDAIDLREALIEARLGQGRADAWMAYRRTA